MLLPRVARPWRDRGALRRVSCAGALAAEEGVHGWDPTALRAEDWVGGRGGQGACSEEGVCVGGDHIQSFLDSPYHSFNFSFL